MKLNYLRNLFLGALMLLSFQGLMAQNPLIWGTSPFQDSMWAIDTTNWTVVNRLAPSLAGATITGINSLAWDPITHQTFAILKVSGVTGRVLATIDLPTGVCTQIGNLGNNFSSLTFRNDGQLLGVTGDGAPTNSETLFLIDKTTAVATLAIPLGNGADGEVIEYNFDDGMIYHWSGNGTVVFEKFPATAPYTPVTNIPTVGVVGGETFGTVYLGNGDFIISNINSNFIHLDTQGNYGNSLITLPDDLRGLVLPPIFNLSDDTICRRQSATWNMVGLAQDTAVYIWGDGNTTTVFPAGPSTHTYNTAGNFTSYAILKNDTVGNDTMASSPIRVFALPLVGLTPATDTLLCLTDTLRITASGGGTSQWYANGAPISGATTSGYTITAAGWYNMVKTNQNGCSDSAATGVYVSFGDQPFVDLGQDSTICDGDSLCFSQSNPGGVSYLWSNGSTSASSCIANPGVFSVTATDPAGCVATDAVNIEVLYMPTPSISYDSIDCPLFAFISNDSNATQWAWTFGDGGSSTAANPSHTYLNNGFYTILVTASNSCYSATDSVTLSFFCIIATDPNLRNALTISPNPGQGDFVLRAELPFASELAYEITDVNGRVLQQEIKTEVQREWSTPIQLNAAPGVYFLKVTIAGASAVYRLLIQ